MIQNIIVGIIFLAAVCYLLRMAYKTFFTKTACASGCGKCGAVDFAKIEKELKQKGI
jgi:hypothetical protein